MYKKTINIQKKYQPSTLQESFLDFILSRQAMLCTPRTLKFYKDTLGKLLEWLEQEGISEPEEITARHIREFLASYAERGCSDSYVHTYARSTRTFLRFLYTEEYIPHQVKFQMPKIGEMRLPILSVEEVKKVLKACYHLRDKAIILLMVDTGIRQAEICSLDWGDIDLQTGICIIRKGKGKKTRSVVLDITTLELCFHTVEMYLMMRRTAKPSSPFWSMYWSKKILLVDLSWFWIALLTTRTLRP